MTHSKKLGLSRLAEVKEGEKRQEVLNERRKLNLLNETGQIIEFGTETTVLAANDLLTEPTIGRNHRSRWGDEVGMKELNLSKRPRLPG